MKNQEVERQPISLIGMSGSGKSHWASRLQAEGFQRFCCDDLIEARLGDELTALGFSGIQDVAKWMGQPFEPQHPAASKRYLELEGEVLKQSLEQIKLSEGYQRIVIDTTGSVIYLADEVLVTMAERTRVVYFETPPEVTDRMYQLYQADLKPVIWGDSFLQKEGEDNIQALGRCYSELLEFRRGQYVKLAHVTVGYHDLRNPNFTTQDFRNLVYS